MGTGTSRDADFPQFEPAGSEPVPISSHPLRVRVRHAERADYIRFRFRQAQASRPIRPAAANNSADGSGTAAATPRLWL
jgi:hypothetical protein